MREEILNNIKKESELYSEVQNELYFIRKYKYERMLSKKANDCFNSGDMQGYALCLDKLKVLNTSFKDEIVKSRVDYIYDIYKKYEQFIKDDTNKIYVYAGSFFYTGYSDSELANNKKPFLDVNYDSLKVDFRIYWNLEGTEAVKVDIKDCYDFEKNNNVIFVNSYKEIQKLFLLYSVDYGQKAAKKMILDKCDRFYNL